MCNLKFDLDGIDLTFGIELPDFSEPASEAQFSVLDGIFDEPGDALDDALTEEPTSEAGRRTVH